MKPEKIALNDNFINIAIAHRGLHTPEISENSMEAFRRAIANNYAIEIDVHLTTDGQLAVVHDSNLERVTGKNAIVENLSSEELKNYPLKDGQRIPLLKDLLDLIDGKVPLLIELKFGSVFDHNQADALLELLETYPYPDMVALQSFHPAAVKYLKTHTDKYSAGFLSSYDLKPKNKLVKYALKSLTVARFIHADFISYDIIYLPNKYVEKQKKRGLKILTWTINSKEKEALAKDIADNIIFERIIPDKK